MKKALIALMIFAMLAVSCLAVPVMANEEPAATVDDALIVHYDFEGDTLEEQLSDKASGGESKENLTLYTTQSEGGEDLTYIKDGVVHISNEKGNYLSCIFDATSGVGKDIYENDSEMTIFVSFMAGGAPTAFMDLFDINNVARTYVGAASENKLTANLGLRVTSTAYDSGSHNVPLTDSMLYLGADEVCFAVTLKYDSEAKTLDITARISYDGGKNYTSATKSFSDIEGYFSNSPHLSLGKQVRYANVDRKGIFDIDEIRVYNKVLSLDEIKAITPVEETPGGTTGENPGGTTDEPIGGTTDSTVTTAPADNSETNAPAQSGTAPAPAEEEKGCASAVGFGGTVTFALVAGACLLRKKKNRSL